jgi:hypothetical protein
MIASKTHVRCGTPDCDWGTPLPSNEDQLSRCHQEFREHCIERHGMNPEEHRNESAGTSGVERITYCCVGCSWCERINLEAR